MEQKSNDQIAEIVRQGQAIVRIENDTQQQLALQRPRDQKRVQRAVLSELESSPEFASAVFYSIPFAEHAGSERKINVEGTGIDGAVIMARHWGNCSHGFRFTAEDDRNIVLTGFFMDYETNTRITRDVRVPKVAWRRNVKAEVALSARELIMASQAGGSKAQRNAILAAMPPALKLEFFKKAKELTVRKLGNAKTKKAEPNAIAVSVNAVSRLTSLGVELDAILKYAKVNEPGEIGDQTASHLVGLANAIRDGEISKEEVFGSAAAREDAKSSGDLKAMLKPEAGEIPVGDEQEAGTGYSAEYQALEKELGEYRDATPAKLESWGKKAATRISRLSDDEAEVLRVAYRALRADLKLKAEAKAEAKAAVKSAKG